MLNILDTIGNTPLLKLNRLVPENSAEVWIKMESFNPTGSYKDRMAKNVILKALERGSIDSSSTLVEYTGGSTGTSLAFVAAVMGLKFVAVSSDAFEASKIKAMQHYGAEVIIIPSNGKGITPELIQAMKHKAYALADNTNTFYIDQFGSEAVVNGYAPMGTEIVQTLGGGFDYFCASVGSAGALMGCLKGIHAEMHYPKVIALEPAQSPLLSKGTGGPHKVDGIGVGFYPPFLDQSKLTEVVAVDQDKAFHMKHELATKEGIYCGNSTGLNVSAAIDLAQKLNPKMKIVTLGCDTGYKYK